MEKSLNINFHLILFILWPHFYLKDYKDNEKMGLMNEYNVIICDQPINTNKYKWVGRYILYSLSSYHGFLILVISFT